MRNFKILLLIFILSSKPFLLSSQRTCGTDHFHNTNMEKPEYQKWFKGIERKIEDELQRNRPKGIRNTIHVPVAIHFNGGVTNANMCCLINASLAQIQVLNDDFASINADIQLYENIAQQCPNNFPLGSLSDGTNIQFFLATSNHPSGSGLINGDYAITVGQESWPNAGSEWSGYLNIFVQDNLNHLGIAPLNGGANPNGNGVQILASAFGGAGINCNSGTGINTNGTYNLGRTGTHEVGHYFGLRHIFDGCNNGDGIGDTPNQSVENFGAPTINFNTCTSNAENSCNTQDFFMNYMDYTDDVSMYMFTNGQTNVMDVVCSQGSWKSNTNNSNICITYDQPQLTTYALTNTCTQGTVNLNSIEVTNESPCNTTIVWSLDNNPNDGITTLTNTQISVAGNYYAYFFNAVHNCYSAPSQPVLITINPFCNGSNLEVNSSVVINTNQEFNKITIKPNGFLTISNGAVVKIIDKIEIEEGGKLFVNSATLTNCDCQSTWQGIQAWGNPWTGQTHAVELKNEAIIENAVIGINTSNPVYGGIFGAFNLSGAKVTSENSLIRNCGIGVNFGPYGLSGSWFSYGDQSKFTNTYFTNCGTGVVLQGNLGVEFTNSSFTGSNTIGIEVKNSQIDVTGCDFAGFQGILFSATWPSLVGSSITNNSFFSTDGIFMDAQGNATPHQILGNFFGSESGLLGFGQSAFNVQANDFANNIGGVSSWYTGDDYNLVSDNGFLGNQYGNSAYGDNNIEYTDNCFDFSGTADIELYSGASIFPSQGDETEAAGNCFSFGATRILTGAGSVPFDYFVKSGTTPQSCKKPGIGNFSEYPSIDDNQQGCGIGVWTTLPPKYRNCIIPNNLKDKKLMEDALKAEIDRIKKDPNISPALKKWLIARYERCLKRLKGEIGLQIIKEETNGKEKAIEYFSTQPLFSHKIMAYAIMMEADELSRAAAYLNGLTTDNSAQADFVFANNLFLSYLNNRNEFVLENATKETLRTKAMAANELSGYARSIYYELTGVRLRIPLSHTNHSEPRTSNYNSLHEGKISSYPNPVTGNEHIVDINTNVYDQKYVINVKDVMGRIMKSENGDHGENVLDMTDVTNGIYIIEVMSGNDRLFTTKVVRL